MKSPANVNCEGEYKPTFDQDVSFPSAYSYPLHTGHYYEISISITIGQLETGFRFI